MKRTVCLRIKNFAGDDSVQNDFKYDLVWALHAEISESFQDIASARVAPGSGITAQMTEKNDRLQFRDSGPGNGAEMRRALSHLYGRFFARGLLEWHFKIKNILPITGSKPMSTGFGVTTSMKSGKTGNMPDWLGTLTGGGYVLGEAKGSFKGSAKSWLSATPPHQCVKTAIDQINNCEIRDSKGIVISANRWAVANLWATDKNQRPPVMIAWDPPSDGERITRDQWPRHETEMRLRYADSMLRAFGRRDLIRPLNGETDSGSRRRGRTMIVPRETPKRGSPPLAVGYTAIWYHGNIFPVGDLLAPFGAPWGWKRGIYSIRSGVRVVTLRQETLDPTNREMLIGGFGGSEGIDQYGTYGRSGLCVFRADRVRILPVSPDKELIDTEIVPV